MTKNTSLKYFRQIWKYADWSVVILRISVTFFKYKHYVCLFRKAGKLDSSTELLKLARRMPVNISAFSFIIFVGISVSWHALEVSSFKISLRISSLFIFQKENVLDVCYILLLQRVCWDDSYILQHILKQDHWYC